MNPGTGLALTRQARTRPIHFSLNISPIRNWRALEVFLYLWWQGSEINPLYDKGLERIGCYLCPAMLESEYEVLRTIHPGYANRWDSFLETWAGKKGLPGVFYKWGLWRWRALPPKMMELCRSKGIIVNDDYSLRREPDLVTKNAVNKNEGTKMEPKMENQGCAEFEVVGSERISLFSATSFTSTTQQRVFHRSPLLKRWSSSNTGTGQM